MYDDRAGSFRNRDNGISLILSVRPVQPDFTIAQTTGFVRRSLTFRILDIYIDRDIYIYASGPALKKYKFPFSSEKQVTVHSCDRCKFLRLLLFLLFLVIEKNGI